MSPISGLGTFASSTRFPLLFGASQCGQIQVQTATRNACHVSAFLTNALPCQQSSSKLQLLYVSFIYISSQSVAKFSFFRRPDSPRVRAAGHMLLRRTSAKVAKSPNPPPVFLVLLGNACTGSTGQHIWESEVRIAGTPGPQ